MTIYFIIGLGADERVFQNLVFPDQWKIVHIPWPELSPQETLQSYAIKISAVINANEDFVIAGLSFGGLLTIELTRILSPRLAIIISSIATRKELPFVYRIASSLHLNKLVPGTMINKIYPFTNWLFGVRTRNEKSLLKQIIHDTSPVFVSWAINEFIHWQNQERPSQLFHIHGTCDQLLPAKLTRADLLVAGAGHLMVYSQAGLVSGIIIDKINSID